MLWADSVIFSSLDDLEAVCSVPGWDGFDAEAVPSSSVEIARMIPSFEFKASPAGCIEASYAVTGNADLIVIISPEGSHYVGFFNGNVSFEKKFKNNKILDTVVAINGFIDWYRYFYQ